MLNTNSNIETGTSEEGVCSNRKFLNCTHRNLGLIVTRDNIAAEKILLNKSKLIKLKQLYKRIFRLELRANTWSVSHFLCLRCLSSCLSENVNRRPFVETNECNCYCKLRDVQRHVTIGFGSVSVEIY